MVYYCYTHIKGDDFEGWWTVIEEVMVIDANMHASYDGESGLIWWWLMINDD